MRQMFIVFVLISTTACSQKSEKVDATIFLKGLELAEVTNPRLSEISGIAASISNPDYLWTHNDSGNGAEVFLIDQKLNIKLTCKLQGVVNRDWEDIAVGPGPEAGKSYVYIADIGDNLAIFQFKKIYRFEEPVWSEDKKEIIISTFDTITFQLAGNKKDTESIMINPLTKDLYIISKWEGPESLYELKHPYSTRDTLTASLVMSLPLSRIVAADFSDDGQEIIMKNYDNVYYWKVLGRPVKDVLKERPYIVEYKKEPQGEAITFANDGSGFFTVSEQSKKEKSYLYFYPRKQ